MAGAPSASGRSNLNVKHTVKGQRKARRCPFCLGTCRTTCPSCKLGCLRWGYSGQEEAEAHWLPFSEYIRGFATGDGVCAPTLKRPKPSLTPQRSQNTHLRKTAAIPTENRRGFQTLTAPPHTSVTGPFHSCSGNRYQLRCASVLSSFKRSRLATVLSMIRSWLQSSGSVSDTAPSSTTPAINTDMPAPNTKASLAGSS